jgi:alpha-galactosidase
MFLTLLAFGPTRLQNPADVLLLQNLDLSAMEQEWGSPHKGRSVEDHALSIGGKHFDIGVGTHAASNMAIRLNGAAKRFSATVGVDDETGGQGSVEFRIYVDGKVAADSGILRSGSLKELSADLTGARSLRLEVTDAGDGIDHDHADWASAEIVTLPGRSAEIKAAVVPREPPMEIAMTAPDRPELNGPRVVGTTPGNEFLFRIPASGKRPLRFAATGLPSGLRLDGERGIISGVVAAPGRYKARIEVSGAAGRDARQLEIVAGTHDLALTPPMGWNSWNVWATSVDADKVRAAADSFIKTGLADYGYGYVNIDDAWEGDRDANGEIVPNKKFGDMGALATYVHSLGLKLGIYSSPGPQTCAGYAASYRHEFQDAKTYANWGVDYLKYDWCSYGGIDPHPDLAGLQHPYLLMRSALDASGRDIVFSLCQYGMGDVYNWGKEVGGNLWRTTGDITDTWSSMTGNGFSHSPKAVGVSPGGWNDPDMLVVGNLGWGPNPHPTRLTPNEQITHISLWSILAAPLIIGCDLTALDPFTKALLTNHDVIEIDQDPLGKAGTRRVKDGDSEVWARPLWDGTYAVGLFNRGAEHARIRVNWKDVDPSLAKDLPVRDLWRRRDLGRFAGGFASEVPAHGAVLIRVGDIRE